MSYNSYKNSFLYCFYQFPKVFSFSIIMMFSDEANLIYIPLSSVIVLLIILLTCASRRRKLNTFSAIEKSTEDDIKGEYAVMCFPCLKKKPDANDYEPTTDLSDQFEYIVEKYTIRKVPLLLANTVEDVIERSEELEMNKAENNLKQLTQLEKDEFVNFQVAQEEIDFINDQKLTPCITVAANTVCPAKTVCKERPKPSDILESMSPIPRSPVRNHNYVVIPTKGSLRHKDVMMTKREITTQYLNNFSSVFIDNLKDQVPKDPDQFPNLSRPYTSAFKNYPIPPPAPGKSSSKKSKKDKLQRVAYVFPSEDVGGNDENSNEEELYYDSESGAEQNAEFTENEFQEDRKDGSLQNSETMETSNGNTATLGKNSLKTEQNFSVLNLQTPCELLLEHTSQKEKQLSPKNVTYEDIQALDLGYEFGSCEKLGVKPKMTRIRYPHETDKLVETIKQLASNENAKTYKKTFAQDHSAKKNFIRTSIPEKGLSFTPEHISAASRNPQPPLPAHGNSFIAPAAKFSSKDIFTETCFLSKSEPASSPEESVEPQTESLVNDQMSTITFTSKSLDGSKSRSVNDLRQNEASGRGGMADSVAEISKLYDLTMPMTQQHESCAEFEPDIKDFRFPAPSKSRSFQESGRSGLRREIASGKNFLPYNLDKQINRVQESETETSYSLYSPESKTSTVMTSNRSSDVEEGKRATLRWKIIIKHHKQNNSSRKIDKKFSS